MNQLRFLLKTGYSIIRYSIDPAATGTPYDHQERQRMRTENKPRTPFFRRKFALR